MMQATGIEWTDATSNPLKYRDKVSGKVVWACVKHSAGCAHCYAETIALRYGRGGPFSKASMEKVEPFLDEKELRQLLTSKKLAGKRVFLADMTDLFGDWVNDDLLNRLFSNVLELRTDVTFQILTKRAERMKDYLSWRWGEGRIPARNIWLGVSVEDQAAADKRIPLLLQTPARVRFLSCEPLLGPVELRPHLFAKVNHFQSNPALILGPKVDWVIVGGESGPSARPCRVEWIRSIVEQCKAAGVPCFVKQLGSMPLGEEYCRFESENEWVCKARSWLGGISGGGTKYKQPEKAKCFDSRDRRCAIGRDFMQATKDGAYPVIAYSQLLLSDRKGGDIEEWPADLRVREFPT